MLDGEENGQTNFEHKLHPCWHPVCNLMADSGQLFIAIYCQSLICFILWRKFCPSIKIKQHTHTQHPVNFHNILMILLTLNVTISISNPALIFIKEYRMHFDRIEGVMGRLGTRVNLLVMHWRCTNKYKCMRKSLKSINDAPFSRHFSDMRRNISREKTKISSFSQPQKCR